MKRPHLPAEATFPNASASPHWSPSPKALRPLTWGKHRPTCFTSWQCSCQPMPRLSLCAKITHDIHANHVICSWFYSKLCTPGPPGKTGFSSNVNLNKAIDIPKHWWKAHKQNTVQTSIIKYICAISVPLVPSLPKSQLGCRQSRLCTNLRGTKHEPRKGCTQMSWKGRSLKVCFYDFACFRWCNSPSWWFYIERTHLSET